MPSHNSVSKKPGTNVFAITGAIKAWLTSYETKGLPDGVRLNITNDQSVFTKDNLGKLQSNAVCGVVFVLILLWGFLGWRGAFFVAVGMPVTFMATFIVMEISGKSLNDSSLFGLV